MTPPDTAVLDYAAPAARSRFRWLDTLGWAAYLGGSWTWCIGMFLPVLLVRDFGMLGWWEFALPNVLGAAAMAWVIRSRRHSEELVAAHGPAIRAFSLVTLAFHFFFIAWIVHMTSHVARSLMDVAPHYVEPALFWPAVVIIPFLAIYLLLGRRADRAVAGVVLIVSLMIAVMGLIEGWLDFRGIGQPVLSTTQAANVACLIPVMVFGFAFCPYLDQTFHRARQATEGAQGRWAFGIGFGVFFMLMILMTLGYADILEPGKLEMRIFFPAMAVPIALLLHLFVQCGFTMGLHFRNATRPGGRELSARSVVAGIAASIGGILVWLAVLAYGAGAMIWPGFSQGEFAYRGFMSFYGLIFPAYVLLCMKPWRTDPAPPTPRQWALFAVAVAVAAPMYWLAFIDDKMIWLLPALAWIGLLSRFGQRSDKRIVAD